MDPVAAPDSEALVLPLQQVGLADIPQVGGKNASLGAGPARFRHHSRGLSAAAAPQRSGGAPAATAQRARCGGSGGPAAGGTHGPPVARAGHPARRIGGRHHRCLPVDGCPTGGRALQRHRGGPAGSKLRGTAGNVPLHRGGSGPPAGLPPLLGLPLHRPGPLLPPAARLRPPGGGPLNRGAAHGPLRSGELRGDVHDRHRIGIPQRRAAHRCLGPGRNGGAGVGEPR
jgi:hypothetical protein